VLDAGSLEPVARLGDWEVIISRRFDGRPIILASSFAREQSQLAVLDPRSFDVLHSWPVDTYASWVTIP